MFSLSDLNDNDNNMSSLIGWIMLEYRQISNKYLNNVQFKRFKW